MIGLKMNFDQIRNVVYKEANDMLMQPKGSISTESCKALLSRLFTDGFVKVKDVVPVEKGNNPFCSLRINSTDQQKRIVELYLGAVSRYNFSHFCHELVHICQDFCTNLPTFINKKGTALGLKNGNHIFEKLELNLIKNIMNSKNPKINDVSELQKLIGESLTKAIKDAGIDTSKYTPEQMMDLYQYINGHAILEKEAHTVEKNVFAKSNGKDSYKIDHNLFTEIESGETCLNPSVYAQIRKYTGSKMLEIYKGNNS